MQDNLIGSLNYTAKIPVENKPEEFKTFTDRPFDISPVGINDLLLGSRSKPFNTSDFITDTKGKYAKEALGKDPYFVNRYEYNRYIKTDPTNFFDWKKNPIFKDPRYYDNEELNAKNNGAFRDLVNGTSKMLPNALSAFVNGFDIRPGVHDNEFYSNWNKC